MKECVFCRILKKEIPSYELFQDEDIFVFLDVNPVSKGHLLIIPKNHYADIFETPEEILSKINIVCKKMAHLLQISLGASGVNILNAAGKSAQQSVFHLHYHVVPRFDNDNLDLWFHGNSNLKESLTDVKEKLLSDLKMIKQIE